MMILVNLLCVTHTHAIEHLGRKGKRRSGKGRKRVASLVFEAQEKKRLTRENQKKEKRRKRKTDELNYVLLGLSVCFLVFFFFFLACLFVCFLLFFSLLSHSIRSDYTNCAASNKKKKVHMNRKSKTHICLVLLNPLPRPLPLSPHTKKKKKELPHIKRTIQKERQS